MINLSKIFKYKWSCLILVCFFLSCEKKEKVIEQENINNFHETQVAFAKSTTYIHQKYIKSKFFTGKILIPNDSDFIRKNIYYDKYLGNLLPNDIISVSFRNCSFCTNNSDLDIELFFEIESKSYQQYYYVYRYCDTNVKEISESLNYKSIPINKKWSLEIEKN